MQTPAPPSMKPGAVSVEGAGRAPGSFGTREPGSDLAGPVPEDGTNVFFPNGMSPGINEVTYYNGATPPPAGGGGKAMRNVKAV